MGYYRVNCITTAPTGMVGMSVDGRYPGCCREQDSVPVYPSEWFPNGRTAQHTGRMKERAREVSVPV